ncbi:S1C family serine protease [Sphaerotilus mobilis]|uniref:S1-C subfamily serine protease n=1 Tax=Sphaerotilus mobilis TaxID=47994 RepID=A0A4Q7LDF3_9BURK|nr:S1C family serine protease [Sphaerotilus mobilis]RZS51963.1 S1-C subfamily serine protease [Sphaerotilus mobilis]
MKLVVCSDPLSRWWRAQLSPDVIAPVVWRWVWLAVVALSLGAAMWTPAEAATSEAPRASTQPVSEEERRTMGEALQRASDASIGVLVRVVDGSASAETLGAIRKGSGVVIGEDGVVLTIGYLILEAEQIDLVLDDGRIVPARPLAYDVATGFGLVQSLVPLPLRPVPLGDSAAISADETLMFVSGGQGGAVSPARLLARGQFAGYWEYLIEGALFTAPARPDHSGAGLYNRHGELVGIGSLVLNDTRASLRQPGAWLRPDGAPGGRLPGNLFVPINLFKPIVDELRQRGRSQASERAWLGLSCAESDGRLTVLRVSRDSPAERAGVRQGDRILRIDGAGVDDLPGFYRHIWQGGQAERDVQIEVNRSGEVVRLMLHTVDRQMTLKRATGI